MVLSGLSLLTMLLRGQQACFRPKNGTTPAAKSSNTDTNFKNKYNLKISSF